MGIKKIISVILSCTFLLINNPPIHTEPQSLTSVSQFKRWEEKGSDIRGSFRRLMRWLERSDGPGPVMTRRKVLAATALVLGGCVFSPMGVPPTQPPTDAMPDGGVDSIGDTGSPILDGTTNTHTVSISTSMDNTDNPVTIFEKSTFDGYNDTTTQGLSVFNKYVRSNNAAYDYLGSASNNIWLWKLDKYDIDNITKNGITYVFDGTVHDLVLYAKDGKKIVCQIQAGAYTPYPHRVTISSSGLKGWAGSINMDLKDLTGIYFVNKGGNFITLNGFQKQYAVVPDKTTITTPDKISEKAKAVGVATITETTDGVRLDATMTKGNKSSAGVQIDTKSGGIDLTDPNLKLQGAWSMDGTPLGKDSSLNKNDLTVVGAVQIVKGRHGNAMQITQKGQYLKIDSPKGLSGGTKTQTIAAWIKVSPSTTYGSICGRWSNVNKGGYLLGLTGGKVQYFYNWDAGGVSVVGNATVNDDKWHHVAVTVDGNTITIYVDGKVDSTHTQSKPIGTNNTDPFMIGENGNLDWPLIGIIDDVVVSEKVFSSTEVGNSCNKVDSSDFTAPNLNTLEFNAKGNTPFILQLEDNLGVKLDIYVVGHDASNWKGVKIDLNKAKVYMGSAINLGNVKYARIIVDESFIPATTGTVFNAWVEIKGLRGNPPQNLQAKVKDEIVKPDAPIIELQDVIAVRKGTGLEFKDRFSEFCTKLELPEEIVRLVLELAFMLRGEDIKGDIEGLKFNLSARYSNLLGDDQRNKIVTLNDAALLRLPESMRLLAVAVGLAHEILGHEQGVNDENELTRRDIEMTQRLIMLLGLSIENYIVELEKILDIEGSPYLTELIVSSAKEEIPLIEQVIKGAITELETSAGLMDFPGLLIFDMDKLLEDGSYVERLRQITKINNYKVAVVNHNPSTTTIDGIQDLPDVIIIDVHSLGASGTDIGKEIIRQAKERAASALSVSDIPDSNITLAIQPANLHLYPKDILRQLTLLILSSISLELTNEQREGLKRFFPDLSSYLVDGKRLLFQGEVYYNLEILMQDIKATQQIKKQA